MSRAIAAPSQTEVSSDSTQNWLAGIFKVFMPRLKKLIVADPALEVAEQIAKQTERLAEVRLLTTRGDELLRLLRSEQPELLILSLEITQPTAVKLIPEIARLHPDLFVMATFRELSVRDMDKLGKAGVEDFVPQPIDATQIYRAASEKFGTAFRQHDRHTLSLPVFRADGVRIGETSDLSAGGTRMTLDQPAHRDQSLLIDLEISDGERVRVRCDIVAVDGSNQVHAQFKNLRGPELKRLMAFLAERDAKR